MLMEEIDSFVYILIEFEKWSHVNNEAPAVIFLSFSHIFHELINIFPYQLCGVSDSRENRDFAIFCFNFQLNE